MVVIVFILGGARSGKSELAEAWVAALASAGATPVTYVATGWAADEAMAERIDAHRRRRPAGWATVEAGEDLPAVLRHQRGPVLLDALGTWLARHHDFVVDAAALCAALTDRDGDTVIVSDEVGLSVHPETELGVRFRDALGTLNRAVAAVADRSVLVVAGKAIALQSWAELLP